MDAAALIEPMISGALAGRRPAIIGIAGAQGSGKSTLAAALAARLRGQGVAAAAVSLDDFYLGRSARQALAAQVHPLLATRGVPGSHDLPLLFDVLRRVRAGQALALPRFDKLADDRLPPQHWRRLAPLDVLLLEGWCVGARAQPAALLAEPVNALEAGEDADARWRGFANRALAGSYQRLWARLDRLVFLAAPDWPTVPGWRAEQEAGLARHGTGPGMSAAALARFCAHYERLTRWQLATTPAFASLTLALDGRRRVVSVRAVGSRPCGTSPRPRPVAA